MATYGYLTRSMGSYYTFYIYWEVLSQDIEANTSKVYISWGTRKKKSNSETYNAGSALWARYDSSYLRSGASVNWDMRSRGVGAERSLYNTTRTIQHDDDGAKSLYLYGYLDVGSLQGAYDAEISGYVELPEIPRATKPVLSTSAADMGTAITIDLSGAAVDTFAHSLSYELPDGTIGEIATGLGLVSQSWTVPDFAEMIPEAASGPVTISCTTFDAEGAEIGIQTVALSAIVPADVVPKITAVSVVEAVEGLADQFGAFIQSKSRVSVTIEAEGAKGSEITYIGSTFEGITFMGASWTSGYLSGTGDLNIVSTVKDSRGRMATVVTTVTVLAYYRPSILLFNSWRVDQTGADDPTGDYVALEYVYIVPELNGGNTGEMTVRAKLTMAESYDTTLLSSTALSANTTVYPPAMVSSDNQWDLLITVTDWFGETSEAKFPLPSGAVYVDFHAEGDGMAVGKTSELRDCLDINWPVLLRRGLREPLGLKDGGTGVQSLQDLMALLSLGPLAHFTTAEGAMEWLAAAAHWDLVWWNAAPEASFAAQEVTVSGLSKYNLFVQICCVSSSSSSPRPESAPPTIMMSKEGEEVGGIAFSVSHGSGAYYIRTRKVYITPGEEKIRWETGYYGYSGATNESNTAMTPLYIFATNIRLPVPPEVYSLEVDEASNLYQFYTGVLEPAICFELDEDGNLYAVYPDGETEPQFELDKDGNLYYITED